MDIVGLDAAQVVHFQTWGRPHMAGRVAGEKGKSRICCVGHLVFETEFFSDRTLRCSSWTEKEFFQWKQQTVIAFHTKPTRLIEIRP